MENKNKQQEPLDDFSRAIKERLEEHRTAYGESQWEAIASQIKPIVKRRRLLWAVPAAAAVAALFLLLLWPWSEEQPAAQLAETETPSVESREVVERPKVIAQVVVSSIEPVRQKLVPQPVAESETEEEKITIVEEIEPEVATPTEDTQPMEVQPQISPEKSNGKESSWVAVKKTKKRGKLQLSASAGTAGSMDFNNLFSADEALFADSPQEDMNYLGPEKLPIPSYSGGNDLRPAPEMIIVDQPTSSDYKYPISAGVTARWNFSERFGVETGLVYTYLESDHFYSTYMHRTYRTQKEELHYLGIPVYLTFNVFNTTRWNIYLSTGPMIEKGLVSEKTIKTHGINGVTSQSKSNESIDGVQLSYNVGVGVAFRLIKDWSLYLEPRYSYYFDNDQPASIRTDQRGLFFLTGGIRFEL